MLFVCVGCVGRGTGMKCFQIRQGLATTPTKGNEKGTMKKMLEKYLIPFKMYC